MGTRAFKTLHRTTGRSIKMKTEIYSRFFYFIEKNKFHQLKYYLPNIYNYLNFPNNHQNQYLISELLKNIDF